MILPASFLSRVPSGLKPALKRLCAIGLVFGIAALDACTVAPQTAPPPAPMVVAPPLPAANNPQTRDMSNYLRLPNLAAGHTPVRVGIILPFASGASTTRNLAAAMMKAATLAVYESRNRDIVLMTADEGASPADATAAANKLMAEGAEIIVGPLFGPSVSAVAPIARDHGVPVLAFSTERSVAGNGVYLLSFLPQGEVRRVISYAVSQGHHNFAAMVPQNAYGDVVSGAFTDSVKAMDANSVAVEHFAPGAGTLMNPTNAIAKSNADAVMVAQGGSVLRAIAPMLAFGGLDKGKVKLLGTGLWDDLALTREQSLVGGWFAAPAPDANAVFNAKYREAYGAAPPPLASLAYDAVALVALLAPGEPYRRFTQAALLDPNGFAGVNGIFRFNPDGTSERGLAVLEVTPEGFTVVSPAPKTFQNQGT